MGHFPSEEHPVKIHHDTEVFYIAYNELFLSENPPERKAADSNRKNGQGETQGVSGSCSLPAPWKAADRRGTNDLVSSFYPM